MYPYSIQKLIDSFSKFPGIGPRTAARIAFYLLRQPVSEINSLIEDISSVKKNLRQCKACLRFFNSQRKGDLCEICSNKSRKGDVLCVVEKETDLASIEMNGFYKGLYFILGRTISLMKKEDISALRLGELQERIKNPYKLGLQKKVGEVILALNPTVEGQSTVLFLERKLKDLNIKTTRLGCGLPRGGEVEYADKITLLSAFKNREEI